MLTGSGNILGENVWEAVKTASNISDLSPEQVNPATGTGAVLAPGSVLGTGVLT